MASLQRSHSSNISEPKANARRIKRMDVDDYGIVRLTGRKAGNGGSSSSAPATSGMGSAPDST
jgi:hypothetical protein